MLYPLKEYQRIAVDELKEYFELYFKSNSQKEITFKSPTGSGKTFMISSLVEELAKENSNLNFCIIWCCPGTGDLHEQSFGNVKKYLGGNPVCSLLEDDFFGSRQYIKKHEIVFVNWEKLVSKDKETGGWKNNLMKDQEGANFIDVLNTTRNNGTKIILIVDESHIGSSGSTRINEFKNTIINPDITLEMSATPIGHIDVQVDPQAVINEGMIKIDVIVNEGISKEDRSLEDIDSELLVLQKGFDKRNQILELYKEKNININPLVLIQIPNVDEGEAKKLVIKDFLRERGITEDNGKLKLWCDKNSNFDKKAIRNNEDSTEFLIFKTSIATGWDCPRAHILIKFREGKSETFEIQTIGRILRTAEAKHYNDSILDNAYIFTNIKEFETKPNTYNPNRIKTIFSTMRQGYNKENIKNATQLTSFYRSRQGDYNSATSEYSQYFMKEFMEKFELKEENKYLFASANKEKLEQKGLNLEIFSSDTLLEESVISSSSVDINQTIYGDQVVVRMSDNDVQAQYYEIIKSNLNGLALVRSKSPINSAIIDTLSTFYDAFPRNEKVLSFQKIVVNNKEIFADLINKSTYKFREMLQENAGKKGEKYLFYIDETRGYSSDTHVEIRAPKSLYQPLYVLNPINYLEKHFLNYLDNLDCVEWYWENGPELMRINFGISYNKGMNTFQPDFIIKFKDGTVGIFDTKSDELRVEDTTIKQKALYKYIYDINQNRGYAPKVIGGIVIQKGSVFYYYDGENYHPYSQDITGWKPFNALIAEIEKQIDILSYNKKN